MDEFGDHFSTQAKTYAEFRPVYPKELFVWLSSLCVERKKCWDVATGNGQAAVELAEFFESVSATDASAEQIAQAKKHSKVSYSTEAAEKTLLAEKSCDLITVAQAAHWFKHEQFYNEVRRVSKPDAVIALWSYGVHTIEPTIDSIVNYFYSTVVGEYWPPERRYIETEYRTLPFPFTEIKTPEFAIHDKYTLRQLTGYLESWSSTQRYIKARGKNPIAIIQDDLKAAWGGADARSIRWPLYLKVAKVSSVA